MPLPILFDLRDVRVATLGAAMTLDAILDAMLDATRPPDVPAERLCAQVVRTRLAQGDAVVVFDGLDEVLVHLPPHDRQLFTRQLWRATERRAGTRMLLTCRTQYFRTIRDEASYFTGESRQGLRGDDYLALLMLPFRDEQVREYLAANLGRDEAWVDGFLDTIAAVHDLPDLARRPLTLRLVADQVEFIETAKLEGRTLRAVDLYAEVVDRWLARDTGKHTLTREHKHLLMEEIAAALWRSGKNSWTAQEVDDWLLALLARRPDLELHYGRADAGPVEGRLPHRDLPQARRRHVRLRPPLAVRVLPGPVPAPGAGRRRHRCAGDAGTEPGGARLPRAAGRRRRRVGARGAGADRAAVHGAGVGAGVRLRGAGGRPRASAPVARGGMPRRCAPGGVGDRVARRRRAAVAGRAPTCRGADLRRAEFRRVDLSAANLARADLTLAELHDSRLRSVHVDGVRAVGTVFRTCLLDDTDLSRATMYRTQVLRCTPMPQPVAGLLLAPAADERAAGVPRPLTGHRGAVNAVAWSPDGTRLATAGDDGTTRLWDPTTGEQLTTLTGHTGSVNAVAWSPDGTRLATAGDDARRLWDPVRASGEADHRPVPHPPHRRVSPWPGPPTAPAWPPPAATAPRRRLLGPHRRSGKPHRPSPPHPGHTNAVTAVAWSPDGTRLATASDDGTRCGCGTPPPASTSTPSPATPTG